MTYVMTQVNELPKEVAQAKRLNKLIWFPGIKLTQKHFSGRPPMDTELVLRAALYRLRYGCPWKCLSGFGPWERIYSRWRQWVDRGIWNKILVKLASKSGGKLWSIDSTSCKVHKHGHGAKSTDDECIGKSRGGPNNKIHALVDGKCRIIFMLISPGNRNDSLFGIDLCDAAPNGVTILTDKAYDTADLRAFLADIGLHCCIPPKGNRGNPASYIIRESTRNGIG